MVSNLHPAGEERRWERLAVDVPIRVVAAALPGSGVIPGRGTRISEGGICLFALANLAIGAHIDVELVDSRSDTPVRVSGIVRNRLVYLYGVEFLLDQQKDRQHIARMSRAFSRTSGAGSS